MRLRQKLVYSPSCTESVFLLGDVMAQLDVSSRASCAMQQEASRQRSAVVMIDTMCFVCIVIDSMPNRYRLTR